MKKQTVKDRIAQLAAAGIPNNRIAELLNITEQHVATAKYKLKQDGVDLPPPEDDVTQVTITIPKGALAFAQKIAETEQLPVDQVLGRIVDKHLAWRVFSPVS